MKARNLLSTAATVFALSACGTINSKKCQDSSLSNKSVILGSKMSETQDVSGTAEEVCRNVYETLNQIYLSVEDYYGIEACTGAEKFASDLAKVVSQLKELKLNYAACVSQFEPMSDVIDPLGDYAQRNFDFIKILVDRLEQTVRQSFVSIDEKQRYQNLLLASVTCLADVENLFLTYMDAGYESPLNQSELVLVLEKIQNLVRMLENKRLMLCIK